MAYTKAKLKNNDDRAMYKEINVLPMSGIIHSCKKWLNCRIRIYNERLSKLILIKIRRETEIW
jgi:hypothetical protein